MAENNQESINRLIQSTQQTNRLATIAICFQSGASLLLFGWTFWNTWQRKRPSLAVRLIRKKGEITKTELRNKSELERKKLELEILEREIKHESELKEFEVGLEKKEEKEVLADMDLLNKLNNLKEFGKEVLTKNAGEIKEKFNKLKDKIPNPLEK